jgi:regulator of protease activity HflC (stomatin/prohibitin superfamily)
VAIAPWSSLDFFLRAGLARRAQASRDLGTIAAAAPTGLWLWRLAASFRLATPRLLFSRRPIMMLTWGGDNMFEFFSLGTVVIVGFVLIWFWNSLYIIKEWERGVVLRLGRLLPEAKGAGLNLVFWPIESLTRINLRLETLDVPPQDIITRDNVSVKVNAVCYFRVVDANLALSQVQNYTYATSQLAQTTIRSVVGQFELDEILSQRDKVNAKLQIILDTETEPWGIKVTKVEVKQVDIPEQMQRAIAKQAEAERERRAKIIHADGEYEASAKLAEAAKVLETQPSAIQLRYLQTLTEIGVEKNTTIVFPLPIDIINSWVQALGGQRK